MGTVEELKAARDLIEKGWHKGTFNSGEHYCAIGAINYAQTGQPWLSNGHEAREAIRAHVPDGYVSPAGICSISAFNDDPKTTKQDILHLFDKAIADLGGMA